MGASATLDRETKDTYSVRVIAKDPSDSRATIDVMIELTNVEENPSIVSGTTEITQTEITYDSNDARQPATTTRDGDVDVSSFATVDGDEAGIRIAVYRATDQEDSNPTLLKWSLTGADADRFRICDHSDEPPLLTLTLAIDDQLNCGVEDISSTHSSTSTVELLLMELPDYEEPANSNNTYKVKLTVADDTRPTSLTATTEEIVVKIINVDEPGMVELSHVHPILGVDIKATLTDPDKASGNPTWQWYAGSGGNELIDHSSARSATFRPSTSTLETIEGDQLKAVASYTDGHGSNKTAESPVTTQTVSRPDPDNVAPAFSVEAVTVTFDEDDEPSDGIVYP